MKIILVILINLYFLECMAVPFKLTNRRYGTNNQAALDTLFNEFENEVNKTLPELDQSKYLDGVSNSIVFSSHGIGVDYANSFNYFILGGGIGFGADPGSNSIASLAAGNVDKSTLSGFAAQASVMGGVRFKRLKIFGNYLSRNLSGNIANFHSKFSVLGFHLQAKIIKEVTFVPLGILEWGGLDVTAGIRKSVMTAVFNKKIEKDVTKTVDGQSATAKINGTFKFGAESSIRTIPMEVSTSLRYFHFFTTYLGVGMITNRGSSSSIVNLDGDFDLSGSSISGGAGATAALDAGKVGGPDSADYYYFVGQQFNLLLLKTYVHLANSPKSNALTIGLGVRVAF